MIFAAGLGTRLRPLTHNIPKALVEVHGKPMLEWVILRFISYGIKNIIINLYHHADQIIDFLKSKNNFGINIELSLEEMLLDTGGGLKKAAWFFKNERSFFIQNSDILTNIDLRKMFAHHTHTQSDVTLSTRSRMTSRYLLFKPDQTLCGWKNINDNKYIWVHEPINEYTELAFSGIHLLSTAVLNDLSTQSVFPIIPEYLRLAKKYKITSFNSDAYKWSDLGNKSNLSDVTNIFSENYFLSLLKYYQA